MKKQLFGILALIISITLLISLVSCSNKPSGNVDDDAPLVRDDSTGSTSAPENNAGNVPDFSAIMAGKGATDTVWGKQDAATRQSIVDSAKEGGYDVSFGADGSDRCIHRTSKPFLSSVCTLCIEILPPFAIGSQTAADQPYN